MGKLVEHFVKESLDQEELVLHTKILKSEEIEELEEKLQTGNPMAVARFYKNLPNAVDYDALEGLTDLVENFDRDKLSEDDRKLIRFFAEDATKGTYRDFLNISGVLIHMTDIAVELEDDTNVIPRNIEVSAYLWIYLNMYEVILDTMTQCLPPYYKKENKRKNSIEHIERKLDEGHHLTAGDIESELNGLGVFDGENNSILSGNRSRFLRNKLGHANIFYDDDANEFILTSGKRYSYEEFMEEYDVLYQFLVEWLFYLNGQDSSVDRTTEDFLTNMSQQNVRSFIEIERGSRRKYNKYILNLKTESD